jgi:hypothetical protein
MSSDKRKAADEEEEMEQKDASRPVKKQRELVSIGPNGPLRVTGDAGDLVTIKNIEATTSAYRRIDGKIVFSKAHLDDLFTRNGKDGLTKEFTIEASAQSKVKFTMTVAKCKCAAPVHDRHDDASDLLRCVDPVFEGTPFHFDERMSFAGHFEVMPYPEGVNVGNRRFCVALAETRMPSSRLPKLTDAGLTLYYQVVIKYVNPMAPAVNALWTHLQAGDRGDLVIQTATDPVRMPSDILIPLLPYVRRQQASPMAAEKKTLDASRHDRQVVLDVFRMVLTAQPPTTTGWTIDQIKSLFAFAEEWLIGEGEGDKPFLPAYYALELAVLDGIYATRVKSFKEKAVLLDELDEIAKLFDRKQIAAYVKEQKVKYDIME